MRERRPGVKTILGYLRPHAPRVAVGVTVKFSAAVQERKTPGKSIMIW